MQKALTPQIALAAIAGLELQKTQIDAQIAELRTILNGGRSESAVTHSETDKGKRKKFSVAARKRMAAAQRARYAKLRGDSEPTEAATAKPKKRKMSAAGRRAISIATKKRWAAIKAAKKTA
jgi:hypothetical protein